MTNAGWGERSDNNRQERVWTAEGWPERAESGDGLRNPNFLPLLLGFGKRRLTPTYSLSGFIGDTVRVRHVVCAIPAEHSIRHTVKNVLCCFATAGGLRKQR